MRYIIALMALLLGIFLMAYAGAQMADAQQVYREGSLAYDNLRERVKGNAKDGQDAKEGQKDQKDQSEKENAPSGGGAQGAAAGETPGFPGTAADNTPQIPRIYVPELDIDFGKLKQINKDTAAWLYSPGTEIDYPVMRADDYDYYLRHLPDGTWNLNGSLFIDYNSAPDFSGPLTIIYGHHMKYQNMMFGSLKGYKDQNYYDAHPYMYLYTEQKNYRIDLLYGCVVSAGKWREQAFMFGENLDALLSYAARNTTFGSAAAYREGDRIIALSTCSYEFDDARYVVLGILREAR